MRSQTINIDSYKEKSTIHGTFLRFEQGFLGRLRLGNNNLQINYSFKIRLLVLNLDSFDFSYSKILN